MARKEVRPVQIEQACDVCGRSMLKGESPEPWLAPGGERRMVCELCAPVAARQGWVRESAAGEVPVATRRPEPRRSLLSRFRPRTERDGADGAPAEAGWGEPPPAFGEPAPAPAEAAPAGDEWGAPAGDGAADDGTAAGPPRRERDPQRDNGGQHGGLREKLAGTVGVGGGRRREPRHVRAVPANAAAKVERAIELFNDSDHPRTIAGIARTLGEPWVGVHPLDTRPHEVVILVAWELSWYRYRVDLGDADQPVLLLEKGEELDQLDEPKRDWNAASLPDGRLIVGVGSRT